MQLPFKVLQHVYGFENGRQTTEKTSYGNNLEARKRLRPEYEGPINCIYSNPPYKTANENGAYNYYVNDPIY